jgi:methylisocitrate lyase
MTRDVLRSLLESEEILVVPGVIDTFSARVAESVGFDALYLGGWTLGANRGLPEELITRSDVVEACRRIVDGIDVPLIADANAGYGNPSHTYRTVVELSKTGVAGVHIEDQAYPKRFHSHAGRVHLVPVEVLISKIEAAIEAREDEGRDVLVIARSDANVGDNDSGGTIEDAVDRVNACLDVGADLAMVFPQTREEMAYVQDHVQGKTLFTLLERFDLRPSQDDLEEVGYAGMLYPSSAIISVSRALNACYSDLRYKGRSTIPSGEYLKHRDSIEELTRLTDYREMEERFGMK